MTTDAKISKTNLSNLIALVLDNKSNTWNGRSVLDGWIRSVVPFVDDQINSTRTRISKDDLQKLKNEVEIPNENCYYEFIENYKSLDYSNPAKYSKMVSVFSNFVHALVKHTVISIEPRKPSAQEMSQVVRRWHPDELDKEVSAANGAIERLAKQAGKEKEWKAILNKFNTTVAFIVKTISSGLTK